MSLARAGWEVTGFALRLCWNTANGLGLPGSLVGASEGRPGNTDSHVNDSFSKHFQAKAAAGWEKLDQDGKEPRGGCDFRSQCGSILIL